MYKHLLYLLGLYHNNITTGMSDDKQESIGRTGMGGFFDRVSGRSSMGRDSSSGRNIDTGDDTKTAEVNFPAQF